MINRLEVLFRSILRLHSGFIVETKNLEAFTLSHFVWLQSKEVSSYKFISLAFLILVNSAAINQIS